jgi:hypothetical protein
MRLRELLLGLSMIVGVAPATAGSADVIAVKITPTGLELYRFDVTVRHADTGWDHYADKWEVISPEGQVLATRTLLHPHVAEQPFTRSLSRVRVPNSMSHVVVRAHDNVDGYGNGSKRVTISDAAE